MLTSNSNRKTTALLALTVSITTLASSFSSVSARPYQYRGDTINNKYSSPYNNYNSNRNYNERQYNSNRNYNDRKYNSNRNYNERKYNSNYNNYNDNKYNNNDRYNNNQNQREDSQRRNRRRDNFYATIPAGTIIETNYPEAKKILVTKEETAAFTLEVTNNVRDRSGNVVIPRGSKIIGEIRPSSGGSRFVGDTLVLENGQEYLINANSKIVTRTEKVGDGRNTDAIWQGAAAGAAAATIIAGVTGDKAIATEEVLGGAGFGALAGFLFGGTREKELISIDAQQDLDLTLTSDLALSY